MDRILENRYVIKDESYIADLANVDFITWRQNSEDGNFWLKMHIGEKEVRYVCKTMNSLNALLGVWTKLKGNEIEIKIGEENVIE
tara:strand:- start:280 stop:534 length:255 start_codon:yes stop_codon:yes gene_type:complete